MMKIKDPVILGFMGGLLGTLGDWVFHFSSFWLKIAGSTTGHYISQLIFPNQNITLSKLLLAEFTHFLAGATLGTVLALLLILSGYDYARLKGIGLGLVLWIVHVIAIPNIVAPRPFLFRTFNEAVVDLTSHVIWGLITASYILYIKERN